MTVCKLFVLRIVIQRYNWIIYERFVTLNHKIVWKRKADIGIR